MPPVRLQSVLASLDQILATDVGVADRYQHRPKRVVPRAPIDTASAALKWYALETADLPIPQEIDELAHAFLVRTQLDARGLGFVILHRCGRDFYFLIVATWRGNNELWETVFYKDGAAMPDFALFPRDAMHKPAFCVWELAAVLHEKGSWERFLTSPRDTAAAETWLRDVYSGVA